jgi:hypothetical protein
MLFIDSQRINKSIKTPFIDTIKKNRKLEKKETN